MIGVFDSGLGGLTILKSIRQRLPEYDYLFLGDNARAPYGSHSFEVVHQFTWQAVERLFAEGCHLVILACNTASAKALRTIQQTELPLVWAKAEGTEGNGLHRVLGVIRPTAEYVAAHTKTAHIGILATEGTVRSLSYPIELQKLNPEIQVVQQACPLWVPIIENGEHLSKGADYFVRKYLTQLLEQDSDIDTIVLACTHFPIMLSKIQTILSEIIAERKLRPISLLSQGDIVADSLADYLRRHPDIAQTATRNASCQYLTTESAEIFHKTASIFMEEPIEAKRIIL